MRAVVTGANGFVGRAMVRRLRADGLDVCATDRAGAGLIAGDLRDGALLEGLFAAPVDVVLHLATVPGGTAEADPALAWDVNVGATKALVGAAARDRARVIHASSIAVFGSLSTELADEETRVAPQSLYGAHKAMMEEWIASQSRRGAIDGVSLRLPGIIARPRSPSGMISAFMSNLFHALLANEPMDLPVGPGATTWMLSRSATVDALVHAITVPVLPEDRRVLMPALRVRMDELIDAAARAAERPSSLIRFRPVEAIEAAFGRLPALTTPRADQLGFAHDGDLDALVASVFDDLARGD